ncbi:MAG: family 16 glycoside hydrolase [Halioglobus sp.]
MSKKVIVLLVLCLLTAGLYWQFKGDSEPEFELEEGFTPLYDGDSLEGWTVIGGESTFEAAGESVLGRHGPGANTFLRTDKTYADFTLKMQMRWDEFGNSGVLLRAQQRAEDGHAYGYQYELDHAERAWSGGIYDEARRGWLASLENNDEARAAIHLDDWNDIRIEARGASLKTWINDVPAADIVDGLDASGYIALQVHSGDKGIMRWRRIRIQEHPALGHPGEGMDSEADWQLEHISDPAVQAGRINGSFTEGTGRMTARRQLDEAISRLTVPACDQPTTIRVRQSSGDGHGASFAQLKVYDDRAEASLVLAGEETVLESIDLNKASVHRVTWVTVGSSLTFTVDDKDVARLTDTGLESRGQFVIEPARCGENFEVAEFSWINLKEKSNEILFYQTLDNEPAPVLTPEQAQADFRVAPGFEVELVAAEPLVEDPVAMAWDEYGRLYVVELRGYMPDAYGTGRNDPVGQVVRLEDKDGDGQMDTSEVFLGQLVNPRAVAVVNEGILIGEPPNLWLCELPTRDAVCESKKSVGDYAPDVETASVEHLENGLRQGLDNWMYNSKSNRRHRLVKGELQLEESLFRGQWGISKDDYGRLFYNHNSTWVQADLFSAEDLVVAGTSSAKPGLGVNLTEVSEVFSVRVNPGVNRAYLEGTLREDGRLDKATGVSGLVVYRGDQFPSGYRNNVFVPEVAANVVAQIAVKEDGMELLAEHQTYDDEEWGKREFLGSTDERFRPVDAMNGPDGALYIIDMYRGIAQDQHFLTDELREQIFQRQLDKPLGHGRIWRVRHNGGKAERGFPALVDVSSEQLMTSLSHPNGWVRDTAQRLLLKREGDLRMGLAKLARGEETLPAIHALWTLAGRGELERALVMEVASIDDPKRQYQVLRAGSPQLLTADVLMLAETMSSAQEQLQMQLAFVMGAHAADPEVRVRLLEILSAQLSSDYVRQAVVRAVQGVELDFLSEVLAGGQLDQPSDAADAVLARLAANAYRTLRGDVTSKEAANPVLQRLLALVGSPPEEKDWQQIAMLGGLENLTITTGFAPAALAEVPPIFADGTISEKNPLWPARLAGRRAFTWPGDELALGMKPLSPEQLQLMGKGEAFYPKCGACHGATGVGTVGLAPALANSPWILGPPEWLARIVLQGMNGPVEIDGEIWNGVMPPHGHMAELDDETLAGLMTFMRRAWGHKADPVSAEVVTAIRADSAGRKQPWTVPELEAVPFDRGYSRYLGKYSVSFLTVTISEEPEGMYMKVPMYGGGVMTQLSDTLFSAAAGGESVKVEFIVEEDGSVNEFLMHRGDEKIPVKRAED